MRYIVLMIGALAVLFAQSQPEKISLQLQWADQFQFAGYYIAKEKGFYRDAGLDVTLRKFDPKMIPVDEVVSGRAEYGVGRSTLLLDRMNGKPVVALAAILQSSPFVLLSAKSSGIRTPRDLIGKRVMMTNDFQDTIAIQAMLSSQGVKMEDITVIDHSFNPFDIANGKADAMACYISNEPFVLQEHGIEFATLNPEQYGFDFYSDILFTTEQEIRLHPGRVRAFLNATLRGWEYAFDHIEETAHLIKERYNDQNKSYQSLVYEGKVLKELAYRGNQTLGALSVDKFRRISDIYKVLGMTQDGEHLEGIVYKDALAPAIFLSAEERSYLRGTKIRYMSTNLWPPFNFSSGHQPDHLEGIAIDFWDLIVQRTGMQTAFVPASTWRGVLDAIKTKTADVTLGTPISDGNEPYALFSKPYASFPAVIVTDRTIDYLAGLSALEGKKVAIKERYGIADTIRRDYPKIRIVDVPHAGEGLKLLSAGEVDAMIDILPVAAFLITQGHFADLKIAGTTGYDFGVRFMIRNDYPELKSILDKAIDSITPAERQAIFNRYIAVAYENRTDYRWAFRIGLAALVVILFLAYRQFEIRRFNQKLVKMAGLDQLTRLPNRMKTDERLREVHDIYQRTHRPYSVIMLDIDWFKRVNDTYGHLVGDKILIEASQIFRNAVRKIDLVGRWGGEEFIIICPETDAEGAYKVATKLQSAISGHLFEAIGALRCSFGISECADKDRPEDVVAKADDALYCAKEEGRDRIRIYGEKICVTCQASRQCRRSAVQATQPPPSI